LKTTTVIGKQQPEKYIAATGWIRVS